MSGKESKKLASIQPPKVLNASLVGFLNLHLVKYSIGVTVEENRCHERMVVRNVEQWRKNDGRG